MKDYLLSEIKAICDDCVGDCDFCEISYECDSLGIEKYPTHWENIEPRDMIELPCKIKVAFDNGKTIRWQVLWRDECGCGDVCHMFCNDKEEADKLLERLKNGKIQG